MSNPLLSLLDLWSRRYVSRINPPAKPVTTADTVITGASEGIGLALAHRFAAGGHTVVLVARNAAKLQAGAEAIKRETGRDAVALVIDVNDAGSGLAIDAALHERGLHADIFINNAGFGLSGEFASQPPADIDALVSCNISALTRLSRHFLPGMLARGTGGLINVASLAGLTPGAYQAAYYASKAYVVSLTRAIAYETGGAGVRVCVVTPGPVETGFHARMNADTSFYRRLVPSPTAQAVAAATFRGYRWHRRVVAPGIGATILSAALRITPAFLVIPATAWMLYPRVGASEQVKSKKVK